MLFVFLVLVFFSFTFPQHLVDISVSLPGDLSYATVNKYGFFPIMHDSDGCHVYSVSDGYPYQKSSISRACIFDIRRSGGGLDTVELLSKAQKDTSSNDTIRINGKDTTVGKISCLRVLSDFVPGIILAGDTAGHIFTIKSVNGGDEDTLPNAYNPPVSLSMKSVVGKDPYGLALVVSNDGSKQKVVKKNFTNNETYGTWIEIAGSNMNSLPQIHDIAMLGNILLISEDRSVFRSDFPYNNQAIKKVSVNPDSLVIKKLSADGDRIFATTDSGFYVSADTAKTWTKVSSDFDGHSNIVPVEVISYYGSAYGFYRSDADGYTYLADWDWNSTGIILPRGVNRGKIKQGINGYFNVQGRIVSKQTSAVIFHLLK